MTGLLDNSGAGLLAVRVRNRDYALIPRPIRVPMPVQTPQEARRARMRAYAEDAYNNNNIVSATWKGKLPAFLAQAYKRDIKPAYDAWTPEISDIWNAPLGLLSGMADAVGTGVQAVTGAGPLIGSGALTPEQETAVAGEGFNLAGMMAGGGGVASKATDVPRGAIGMNAGKASARNSKGLLDGSVQGGLLKAQKQGVSLELTPVIKAAVKRSLDPTSQFGTKVLTRVLRTLGYVPEGTPISPVLKDDLFRFAIELRRQFSDELEASEKMAREARKAELDATFDRDFVPALQEKAAGMWSKSFMRKIAQDMYNGMDTGGSVIKANLEAVPRVLKREGWTVRHASTGKSGRKNSRYLVSPDGKFEVRLSDHYLPDNGFRERTNSRWDAELVLGGDETPQGVIDEIKGLWQQSAE